jgi:hypothetical protein
MNSGASSIRTMWPHARSKAAGARTAPHLRRRGASSEDGAGHSRLVPGEALRNAGLEQLHDLPGRPGWTSENAPSPIFSPRDPRMALPVAAAGHYDRFQPCRDLRQARQVAVVSQFEFLAFQYSDMAEDFVHDADEWLCCI